MLLSDAMMLGATLIKHVDHWSNGNSGCALQCAQVAWGYDRRETRLSEYLNAKYPWAMSKAFPCPISYHSHRNSIAGTVIHLNDDMHWPIERIADWVRSVEPQEELAETGTPAAEVEHVLTRA